MIWFTLDCIYVNLQDRYSLNVNLLAQRPGQEKLDSDKWKFSNAKKKMNLFDYIENFSKFGFRASRWKKLMQRLKVNNYVMLFLPLCMCVSSTCS
jgi:hypothetical protein